MTLVYNIHYEVAAAAFTAILYFYVRLFYGTNKKSSLGFQRLLIALLICDVLNVSTAITISAYQAVPWVFNMVLNTVYFASTIWLGYSYLSYAKHYAYKDSEPNVLSIIGKAVLGFYGILLVANWFTGWIFSFDPGAGYKHGALYNVLFSIPLFYVVAAASIIFKEEKKKGRNNWFILGLFMLIGISGVVLQVLVIPDVLFISFTVTIGLVLIMFTLESPDYEKLVATMKELEETKELAEDAMERAQDANRAKSDFIASVSHELRTPINVVLGMNEMIIRESREDAILNYAKDIDNSGQMLLSLVNDILDFSKIEAGKMQIVEVKYELDSLLHDLYVMIKTRADKKGLGIHFEIDPSTPNLLKGDEVRIRQIALNFLSNAVKYTDKGHIGLTLESKRVAEDKVELCLAVRDTGRGIKQEDIDALFSSFTRVDEVKNRNIEGTGLGLAITKRLVEMMGGEIEVESLYGAGSVFRVRFLQEIMDDREIGHLGQRLEMVANNKAAYRKSFMAPTARILVVDDVVMNLRVFCNLLKETEIQIDAVQRGKQALEMIASQKYHMIFLDHMMPEMDGMECMERIKKMVGHPNYDTPVIMLTANAIVGVREEYLNAGFSDYMSKPFKGDDLEEMIMKYLPEELLVLGGEKQEKDAVLHVNKGIEFCGGSVELYQQVLMDYVEEDRSEALHSYWMEEDWVNYRVQIHAIKSTSQTIGALELYEDALELEEAVKHGDYQFAKEHHESVLCKYRELIEQIRENGIEWSMTD